MKKLFALLLSLCLLAGCSTDPQPTESQAATQQTTQAPTVTTEATEPSGLTLTYPEGVQVELYQGFADSSYPITPAYEDIQDGTVSRFYPDANGIFHYIASGNGFYTVRKNLMIPTGAALTVNADPGKRANTPCDPASSVQIRQYTDEFMAAVSPSDPSLWPQLAEAYTSPFFTNPRQGVHQVTTYEEMMTFLQSLDQPDDRMYLYTLGQTPLYNRDIPIAIFTETDLSGCATWQEAAQQIRDNGKLTVHYQAQIHGNEPAAGESALGLAKMLQGDLGDRLLDTMDIYLIPRMNVDGSEDFIRKSPYMGMDLNRDMLQVANKEVALHHEAFLAFHPHVRFDAHEFVASTNKTSAKHPDIMISTGYGPMNSPEFRDFCTQLASTPFEAVRENGLRPTYYEGTINSANYASGRIYASQRGCVSILLETRGINYGTTAYARRIAAQLIPAIDFLTQMDEDPEKFRSLVEAERQYIIDQGATYDEDDLVALQTGSTTEPAYRNPEPVYLLTDGTEESVDRAVPKNFIVPQRTRPRPTAYVIPAGEAWAEEILVLMTHHGITWETLPAGTKLSLQQYTGTVEEACLTEETGVTFPQGAYFFPMDQESANILALLMEPDVTDVKTYRGTLAQSARIPSQNGAFPIYRYIRDLT